MLPSKASLRSQYREIRRSIGKERRASASKEAANLKYTKARFVLSFSSMPEEINTAELNQCLCETGQLVLPTVFEDRLVCRLVDHLENCTQGPFGIREPTGRVIPLDQIDLAFVPGIVFDQSGGRIGHGYGFYDRILSQIKQKVGLCFKEQVHPQKLPLDPWDQPVDSLIAL